MAVQSLMLGLSLMMNDTGSKPDAAGEATETKTSGSCPVLRTPWTSRTRRSLKEWSVYPGHQDAHEARSAGRT